jgi:ABC-type sugar transport system ATPase subunit
MTSTDTKLRDHPVESTGTVLDARDLHVSYGGVSALHGLSLSVPEGQIVAVLGSNGAGKTTLLRALSGTLPCRAAPSTAAPWSSRVAR